MPKAAVSNTGHHFMRYTGLDSTIGLPAGRGCSSSEAINALLQNYPKTTAFVGATRMALLARAYVETYPAFGPMLIGYGADFATWLCRQHIADEIPHLAGVAQIDRLATESELAPDGPDFGLKGLAALSGGEWATCKVKLHPATRLGWYSSGAPSIWIGDHDRASTDISFAQQPEGILITRSAGLVSALVIDACEHRILHGLRLGETVGQSSLAVAQLYPYANITNAFRRIVASGALSTPSIRGGKS